MSTTTDTPVPEPTTFDRKVDDKARDTYQYGGAEPDLVMALRSAFRAGAVYGANLAAPTPVDETEIARLRQHSTLLNEMAWRIARSVGDVTPGVASITADPMAQLERLIAKAARADSALGGAGGDALIAAERRRQVEQEGYTAEHDASHAKDLALAASCYAAPTDRRALYYMPEGTIPADWPWAREDWKPTPDDRVRELIKAGALCAAAIDAIQAETQEKTS